MSIRNPDQAGLKLNRSRYVWQVVDWITQGASLAECCRRLSDRYGYDVSLPSMSGFKKNFYPERRASQVEEADRLRSKTVARIQTFIDEAHDQAQAVKASIATLNKHIKEIEEDIDFSNKFNKLYRTGVDTFVGTFDPKNPRALFEAGDACLSPEEQGLLEIRDYLREESGSLSAYISAHSPAGGIRLLSQLQKQVLDHRLAIEKIYHNVFKSYRNYSIMQEIMVVFEKYNQIIVDEFFSDADHLDTEKYNSVRNRIFLLFNEVQGRYQTYDGPVSADNSEDKKEKKEKKGKKKKGKKDKNENNENKGKRWETVETVATGIDPDYLSRVQSPGAPPPRPEQYVEDIVQRVVNRMEGVREPQPVDKSLADLNTEMRKKR